MNKLSTKSYAIAFKRALVVQGIAFFSPFALDETGFLAYYRLWEIASLGVIPMIISIVVSLPLILFPAFIYSFYKRMYPKDYFVAANKEHLFFFLFWLLPMFLAPLIYGIVYESLPFPIFYYGYWFFLGAMIIQYIVYYRVIVKKEEIDISDHLINE